MIKKSELWQRIRAARRRAGLTQSDVAAHFEIDRTAVAQWEAKREDRRTRPDIARLEELGHLTRTPIWWLMSDDVDVLDPWPEVTSEREEQKKEPLTGTTLRDFWQGVSVRVREIRSDLWGEDVWAPNGPQWMQPLLPDVMSRRAIVHLVSVPRLDMSRVAHAAASLLAFEKLQGTTYPRRVILVWRPPAGDKTSLQHKSYIIDLDRVADSALLLTERLDVRYIEVTTQAEAAHYLAQLL